MTTSATATDVPGQGAQAPPRTGLDWISWLKVVAITGVVAIHTVGYSAAADGARQSRAGVLAIVLDIGATFAVPIFVMVSGALTLDPARYEGAGPHLRKRALRLVPAVVFWHLFYWWFRVAYLDQEVDARTALLWTLNGDLYTALYFFWIVLGLAVVSPILIPWLATARRSAVLIGATLALAMPVLTTVSYQFRAQPALWIETPWTWWIFYVGLFLFGWGLRGIVLRGPALWLAVATVVGLGATLSWQWKNPDAPVWLQTIAPVSYFGLSVYVYAIAIFLVAQSLIRPGGGLNILTRAPMSRLGRLLGDATLGVFALHLAVIQVVHRVPVLGGDPVVTSSEQLVARVATVFVATFAIVLVLRRVPVVRRLF